MRLALASTLLLLVAIGGSQAAPAPEQRIAFTFHGVLYTVRPDGEAQRRVTKRGTAGGSSPAWSPDARRFAVARSFASTDLDGLFTIRSDGTGPRRLTRDGLDTSPDWSPDGRQIVFSRSGELDRGPHGMEASYVFVVAPNGTGIRQLTSEHYDTHPDWSHDGSTIVFTRSPAFEFFSDPADARLMLVDADGSNVRRFPRGIAGSGAVWSPLGGRVAFTSYRDRNGKKCGRHECWPMGELYVMTANGTGLRRLTRNRWDDRHPTWSPDGKWIAFVSGRTQLGYLRDRIYRVPANGGRPRLVVKMAEAVGKPAWRPR